ncbi:beta-lactamase-like protein [Amylostereum chailletii]|nr:beta-lactamase-like protein [Amylostereum chailletii]
MPPKLPLRSLQSGSSSMNITILGTASAQPSSSRNHSSLALRLNSDVWLFDCGEATQHQIQRSGVKMGRIEKIFITHTHGDHIFGLLPVLASKLNGAGGMVDEAAETRAVDPTTQEPLEIYGPLGTRAYVRNGLTYTHTLLGAPYVVHELRFPSDPVSGDFTDIPLHASESPLGRNIPQVDGEWIDIFKTDSIAVSAAPILHSAPCVGYVIIEAPVPGKMDPKLYVPHIKRTHTPMTVMSRLQQGENVELSDGTVLHGPRRRPGRRLAILGDTYDPSPIAKLAKGVDVLIHEATNAHLPGVDPDTKESDTYESVEARTKSRGHSTPQMAGAFASLIGAQKLVLNHFSARYSGDDREDSVKIMDAIKGLAQENFSGPVTLNRAYQSSGGSESTLLRSLASPSSNSSSRAFFFPLGSSANSPISMSSSSAILDPAREGTAVAGAEDRPRPILPPRILRAVGRADVDLRNVEGVKILALGLSVAERGSSSEDSPSSPSSRSESTGGRGDDGGGSMSATGTGVPSRGVSVSLPMRRREPRSDMIVTRDVFWACMRRFCASWSARMAVISFSRSCKVLIFSANASYSIFCRRSNCACSSEVLSCSMCPRRDPHGAQTKVYGQRHGLGHAPILWRSRWYSSTCLASASHTMTAFLSCRLKDDSSTRKASRKSSREFVGELEAGTVGE